MVLTFPYSIQVQSVLENRTILLSDGCGRTAVALMAPAVVVEMGTTTGLGRPWSARQWYRSELRKRSETKHEPVAPPPAEPTRDAARRRMFDGDLRAPIPERFATPKPPWEPKQRLSPKEKQLQQVRASLGPALKRAMETMMLSGKDQNQRLRAFCRVLDRNGDGVISAAELCDGIALLGPRLPMTKKQVDAVFDRIDRSGGSALSFDDFATLFSAVDARVHETERQDERLAVGQRGSAKADTPREVDTEASIIRTQDWRNMPLSPRDVKWSPPASSFSSMRPFLKQGGGHGSERQAQKRADLAPTLDANVTVFSSTVPKWRPFSHRDVTPEKWLDKDWDRTPGTMERLIEPRAVSLNTHDTTSPEALAAAAAIAADAARAGVECRSKFKFTPRHCRAPRPEPAPVGKYQELWHRSLPIKHPEHVVPSHSPTHATDWIRPNPR
eukprot:COSAG02_NODE_101_length_36804_cov_125.342951_24_plen_443_part_00